MVNVANIVPSDWSEVQKIKFDFKVEKKYHTAQNIISFDIETSNGFLYDGKVLEFKHELYNKYIRENGKTVTNPNYDEQYHHAIDNSVAVSLMYVWQIAIEGDVPYVFMGRTWEELEQFLTHLMKEIRCQAIFGYNPTEPPAYHANAILVAQSCKQCVSTSIWIHNAGFEFQFLRNIFDKKLARGHVFAREPRKPMKWSMSIANVHINFRDTLVLTQKSLKSWCKDEKLPVQKLEEPADYYLPIRTPETPLTQEEINYSINDVVSMLFGLIKYRDKYKLLSNIPLTQTGSVRRKCQQVTTTQDIAWANLCAKITKNYTPDDFVRLAQLFQGGWTHANALYVGKLLKNIRCYDFASSYPAVMTTRRFPVSSFEKKPATDFYKYAREDVHTAEHRWYIKVTFHDVFQKTNASYWSLSKVCIKDKRPCISGQVVDNGRISSCVEMTALMTDLDFDTFLQCYAFSSYEVEELYVAKAGYLSREIILTILDYFKYKTTLKGDPNAESLYTESKQFINSIYGCAVTKIIMDIITYDANGWEKTPYTDADFIETMAKTDDKKTFLAYQMGVWVTAWARHNLFDLIIPLDSRVVYCDTDSIKGLFTDDDIKLVESYNQKIVDLENKVAADINIDPALYTATTSKGKIKRLGIMEREDDCKEFKTLGAKRYVDLVNGELQCTIAGLPKSSGAKMLNCVDDFNNGLEWNTIDSQKLCAIYNDDQPTTTWTDRDGNTYTSNDKYGICLKPTTFDLSMSDTFLEFLATLRTGKINRDDENVFNNTPSYIITREV